MDDIKPIPHIFKVIFSQMKHLQDFSPEKNRSEGQKEDFIRESSVFKADVNGEDDHKDGESDESNF